MFTINNTLNIVVALVVVLLVLSLLVQSIQAFIKKVLKLKSKEIEKSLTELFKYVIDKPAATTATAGTAASAGTSEALATQPSITPEKMVNKVLDEFKNVGRYTKWGRTALDSISKEDLLKILARVDSKHFYADYVTKFQNMYQQIEGLEQAINALVSGDLLRGAASAKFAEMREVLAPLINDVKSLLSGNTIKSDVLFGDLINVRRIKLDDALKLLSEAQESITRDIQAERAAGNDKAVPPLQDLSAALTKIAGLIGQLGQQADEAFAALRSKLDHVERWYDTVMQSFEERYTRHMKNVSIYISIGVVIFLNAGFFRIYRSIASNDDQAALIAKKGEQILEERLRAERANTTNNANTNSNITPGVDNSPNSNSANTSIGANNNSNVTPTLTQTPAGTSIEQLRKDVEEIKSLAGTTQDFGFSPLTWQQLGSWWASFSQKPLSRDWFAYRFTDLKHLIGWTLTVLLLSVGAPFWQDTLESLFGVKNLLRKSSGTKNVEGKSGEGQPRP